MDIKGAEARVLALLPQDKCVHALAGALIFAIVHLPSVSFGLSAWTAPAAVVIAAAAKEVLDAATGGDPSIVDCLATIVGGAITLLASL
jgi:hypothetical protein